MKTSSTSVKKKRSTVLKLQNSIPHVSNTSKSQVSCRSCSSRCVKAGKERGGKQRYLCTSCGKKQVAEFTYNAYNSNTQRQYYFFDQRRSRASFYGSFIENFPNNVDFKDKENRKRNKRTSPCKREKCMR